MLSERRIVQMAIVRSSEGVKFENSSHIPPLDDRVAPA